MKKLELIDIYGWTVSIENVEGLIENNSSQGEYCSESKTIKIDKSLTGYDYQVCLIHECLHALFDRLSFNQAIEIGLEEVMCDNLSKWLIENFRIETK